MASLNPRHLVARGWRSVRSAGTRRLALTSLVLVVALLIARFSWYVPVADDAERALYDLRSTLLAPRVETDQRVLLVVYDDQTLIAARKRSPLDRGLLARALKTLDAMGAKAIGIDILFDQPQDEDDQLVETLRSMKTPVSVAQVDLATNPDDLMWDQQEFLNGFLARLEGSHAHPASIRLDNTYGATRVWPEPVPGLPPELSRSMLTDSRRNGADAAGVYRSNPLPPAVARQRAGFGASLHRAQGRLVCRS